MNVITSMKITRDDKIRVLNLNPKHKTKEEKQKHKD
jgi:ribosomal protein L36